MTALSGFYRMDGALQLLVEALLCSLGISEELLEANFAKKSLHLFTSSPLSFPGEALGPWPSDSGNSVPLRSQRQHRVCRIQVPVARSVNTESKAFALGIQAYDFLCLMTVQVSMGFPGGAELFFGDSELFNFCHFCRFGVGVRHP